MVSRRRTEGNDESGVIEGRGLVNRFLPLYDETDETLHFKGEVISSV